MSDRNESPAFALACDITARQRAEIEALKASKAELLMHLEALVRYTSEMEGCEDWPGLWSGAKDAIAKAKGAQS